MPKESYICEPNHKPNSRRTYNLDFQKEYKINFQRFFFEKGSLNFWLIAQNKDTSRGERPHPFQTQRRKALTGHGGVAGVVCVHQKLSMEASESAQPTADPRPLPETEDHYHHMTHLCFTGPEAEELGYLELMQALQIQDIHFSLLSRSWGPTNLFF